MNTRNQEFDWKRAVRDMPESFRRRIQTTCDTLPEQEKRLPVRGVSLAVALCAIVLLAVFFSIGTPGGAPDALVPLTNSASENETDLPGGGEPAQDADPLLVRDGYTEEELLEAYAEAWPFVDGVYDDNGQLFQEFVYLFEESLDPCYHLDPEKCGAGDRNDMVKTLRQIAYRVYGRELCMECAPQRDLKLMVWLNEGDRCYHKEQECSGATMQIHTTLENAVKIYCVQDLCGRCSGISYDGNIELADDFIINIDRKTYEISLNDEWAVREVYLATDGVYHFDVHCANGETAKLSQLAAVRDREAVPCADCMGEYTGTLVVYYNDGDAHYHALGLCGGKQLSTKAFQMDAIANGKTICSECFKNY